MATAYPTGLDVLTNPTAGSSLTSPSHADQHANINDAVEALQAKVAIGNTVIGNYISYTPTFPLGLTLGNGTATGGYCRVNDFVHVWGRVVLGTTSVMSTSGLQVNVPVACDATFASTNGTVTGFVNMRDTSAAQNYTGLIRNVETFPTTAIIVCQALSGSYLGTLGVTTTAPFTWADTDTIFWSMYYEAA